MTIECHYWRCNHHSYQEYPNEGPFCFEKECRVSEAEDDLLRQLRKMEEETWPLVEKLKSAQRVRMMGYDPDELEEDNPYTQWMRNE